MTSLCTEDHLNSWQEIKGLVMMDTSAIQLWLPYWQPRPQARLRLFCFPYAGGGASIFRTWSELLPSEIELCAVQLPGREKRLQERPYAQMSDLIPSLAVALQPYLVMPYALFGHSMGAFISFELARYLRHTAHHLEPAYLFVSGCRAPQLPDPDPPSYHLPQAEFIDELRRLEGTPETVLQNEELLHLLLPLLRADFSLCETYCYTDDEPLSCPISAFGGLQDHEAPRHMLAAWAKQTTDAFKLRFFAGNHFFLHKEQFSLLQAISHDLFQLAKQDRRNKQWKKDRASRLA
jgi:medium-chain acyl-[acyl-carrier-protein] hydrolase